MTLWLDVQVLVEVRELLRLEVALAVFEDVALGDDVPLFDGVTVEELDLLPVKLEDVETLAVLAAVSDILFEGVLETDRLALKVAVVVALEVWIAELVRVTMLD